MLASLRILLRLRLLSSAGICLRLRYANLSATLTTQSSPHGLPVCVCHTTARASRITTSLIFQACRRYYPGENTSVRLSLTSQCVIGLFPISKESASALVVSRPTQQVLAQAVETERGEFLNYYRDQRSAAGFLPQIWIFAKIHNLHIPAQNILLIVLIPLKFKFGKALSTVSQKAATYIERSRYAAGHGTQLSDRMKP